MTRSPLFPLGVVTFSALAVVAVVYLFVVGCWVVVKEAVR